MAGHQHESINVRDTETSFTVLHQNVRGLLNRSERSFMSWGQCCSSNSIFRREDKRIASPVCDIYVTHHMNTKNTKKVSYLQVISGGKEIKEFSQVPRNKTLKIFHQNIRGLGNKTKELYCHLHHDFPHILCLSEHHLRESELQLTQLTNYSLGASYCRKTFFKGGVSIFVYRNLKYNTININEYNLDKDIEACAIQLDSTFNKLCILAIYRSPRGDFTNFLKRLDLILQKLYNNKYNIVICGVVNVNDLMEGASLMLFYTPTILRV
jgi:hypothetical protein